MQIEIGDYTATLVDGLLTLLQAAERYLPSVTITPDGTTVEAIPYSCVSPHKSSSPVLLANYAGDRCANVDLDCGWQRWNGVRSLRWIRQGLYKAGFAKSDVDAIFRQMRLVGPQAHVAHCW